MLVALPLALAVTAAGGVSQARIDGWLASSPQIVRTMRQAPDGRQHVHVDVDGADGGFVASDEAVEGVLATGQAVMVVPLLSGGTMGINTTLLFTTLGGKTRFVGYVPSQNGHLDVRIDHGALLIRTPIYGPGSGGNCCPSDFHYERTTLRGIRLVTLKTWTAKAPKY